MLVETVSKCLLLIKPDLKLTTVMPPGMAQKFGVTTSLAQACTAVGFRGDIGYQTFLYSNIIEVRRVFMFLIERLPKETEKVTLTQSIDKVTLIENEIARNISQQLSSVWLPQFCIRKNKTLTLETNARKFCPKRLYIPNASLNDVKQEIREYWVKSSPTIFQQTKSNNLLPSIIHTNDLEIFQPSGNGTSIRILQKNNKIQEVNISASNSEIVEEITKEVKLIQISSKESPLDILNTEIETLKKVIEENVTEKNELEQKCDEMNIMKREIETQLIELKDERKIKERISILLENPETNIKKMETVLSATVDRMNNLTEKWEEHRIPLVEALEKSKQKYASKNSKAIQIVEQIKSTQEKCDEISEDLKIKTILHTKLIKEFEKGNKNISRNSYTSRILEIIGNIRKQRNDIDKILKDTRELQKEINNISGQLERQFTVTEDLIYRTAKKDEYSKKSYKLLATLHSDCNELITLVQDTGAIQREIRELEEQIDTEKMKNVASNLERITADLKQMEKESREIQI